MVQQRRQCIKGEPLVIESTTRAFLQREPHRMASYCERCTDQMPPHTICGIFQKSEDLPRIRRFLNQKNDLQHHAVWEFLGRLEQRLSGEGAETEHNEELNA